MGGLKSIGFVRPPFPGRQIFSHEDPGRFVVFLATEGRRGEIRTQFRYGSILSKLVTVNLQHLLLTRNISDFITFYLFPISPPRCNTKHTKCLKMSIFQAANLLPVLRARICGYTGIFRIVESFWPRSASGTLPSPNLSPEGWPGPQGAAGSAQMPPPTRPPNPSHWHQQSRNQKVVDSLLLCYQTHWKEVR